MTTRTFKQLGQAYGSDTCSITVSIDGASVYSGPVSTLDEPLPVQPIANAANFGNVIYTWTQEVTFAGGSTLSIAVSGADLLLCNSQANYVGIDDPENPGNVISGGADVYAGYAYETIDGVAYSRQLTEVTIDGVAQDQTPNPELPGEAFWLIRDGSTFTATINTQAGIE